MRHIIIKSMWMAEGVITLILGITMNEDFLLKLVVALCGLLSVLFSLTFGTVLKHISNHNSQVDQINEKFRTIEQCKTLHESTMTVVESRLTIVSLQIASLATALQRVCPQAIPQETPPDPQEPSQDNN